MNLLMNEGIHEQLPERIWGENPEFLRLRGEFLGSLGGAKSVKNGIKLNLKGWGIDEFIFNFIFILVNGEEGKGEGKKGNKGRNENREKGGIREK